MFELPNRNIFDPVNKDNTMSWKEYFNFNRAERNGVVVLCVLILAVCLIPSIIRFNRTPTTCDFTEFQAEIAEFEKEIAQKIKNDSAKRHTIDFLNVDKSIVEQKNHTVLF